jgi:hypothetical protein
VKARFPLHSACCLGTALVLSGAGAQPLTTAPVSAVADLAQAEALIEALVQRGLLPRARADVLKREAQQRAGVLPAVAARGAAPAAPASAVAARAAQAAPPPAVAASESAPAPETTVQVAAAPVAAASPAAAAATAAPPSAEPGVQRVPYVPQPVREQLRAQLREDLLAVARREQWGAPAVAGAALPAAATAPGSWAQRVTVSGDVRLRWQGDRADNNNLPADEYVAAALAGGTTRAADFAAANALGTALGAPQADRERLRLRARLSVDARVSDNVSAGVRLATGSATDRVSTNQTLGQNANRYTFLLDRAFLRWDPVPWFSIQGGRIANPFLASEAQFSENLNFEGVATLLRWPAAGGRSFEPYLVAGWFPIREDGPAAAGRSLVGVQGGLSFEAARLRLRVALAGYQYRELEARIDPDYTLSAGAGPSYGQYEYGAALRQRGNTLVLTNNPLERSGQGPSAFTFGPDRWRWGLASKFRPIALTVAAESRHFAPQTLALSFEAIQNTAYDRAEIQARTGVALSDGSDKALAVRAVLGEPSPRQRGQWQASLAWRRVGSDAVLDAFTDSDLRGGGTNVVGWSLGGQYALDRDLVLGLRWLSGRSLDGMTGQPAAAGRSGRSQYSLDAVQVDLGARF